MCVCVCVCVWEGGYLMGGYVYMYAEKADIVCFMIPLTTIS
jgi:hypothetical protein